MGDRVQQGMAVGGDPHRGTGPSHHVFTGEGGIPFPENTAHFEVPAAVPT